MNPLRGLRVLALFALAGCAGGPAQAGAETVEILRDRWGIAHVFARTEPGAWFGAGTACAQDRPIQMSLNRRTVQGRLAEVLGPAWIESDRKFRILGLHRQARKLAGEMTGGTREIFEAYARGVNRVLAPGEEPWTAADCVAIWMRVEERFAGNWRNEVGAAGAGAPPRRVDESGVIVPESEFQRASPDVYRALKERRGARAPLPEEPIRKASHAWAVAGSRSTTGKPILESDPQIAVTFPPLWYEVHVSGGGVNARGIGMPGAPGFLIGWNERVAWGATALGGDHSDLFETSGPFESRQETIRVKGGADVGVEVRATPLGPVVNDLLPRSVDKTFALRWVTLEQPSSLEGLLMLSRARDWSEFERGLERYHTPGLNVVYADVDGRIAYRTAGTIPLRDCVHGGSATHSGCTPRDRIPFREMPHMVDPVQGFISHANNSPVGAWYPHEIYGRGDTPRSWRLRELLASRPKFSPAEFLSLIHRDSVNPLIRDFFRLAVQVAREDKAPLDDTTLAILEAWDGRCLVESPAWPLAGANGENLSRSLRGTPLASRYGGGAAGVSWLLKDLVRDPSLLRDPAVRDWLKSTLGIALAGRRRGEGTPAKLLYQDNLEKFGSRRPDADLSLPALRCVLVESIWSQLGNSYTHLVDLGDIDQSLSMLPPGISEDPASPHSRDQMEFWVRGDARPAPLRRPSVEKITISRSLLEYPSGN